MTVAEFIDSFDNFGIVADADDGHESPAAGLTEVEVANRTVIYGIKGTFEGVIESQFAGEEVFGAGRYNKDRLAGTGQGLGDLPYGSVPAGDDNYIIILSDSLASELAGVFKRLGELDINMILALPEGVFELFQAANIGTGTALGIYDEEKSLLGAAFGHVLKS